MSLADIAAQDNLVGYSSTTLLDRMPYRVTPPSDEVIRGQVDILKKKIEEAEKKAREAEKAPAVEMYQAGTGAVRSSDLKKERWDLLSGAALRQLRDAMGRVTPGDADAKRLVDLAADYMWRYLGNNAQGTAVKERVELLTQGWAWLALAMEVEEGIRHHTGPRYPLTAIRRTAMASKEGEVKYGEENWLNGFRVKVLCNHALRHMVRFSNGVVEDDELGHASWGFMAAVHMNLFRPDMCDLLAGVDYTITDELREYHKNHLSRRQVKS